MSNTIVIPVNSGMDAYAIIGELKSMGMLVNKDFTWLFTPRAGDYFSYETTEPPTITITFVEANMASFFRLKWSRND
jgi:hypothetical protein